MRDRPSGSVIMEAAGGEGFRARPARITRFQRFSGEYYAPWKLNHWRKNANARE